ncbi:hypothetical protein ECZU20_55520 [Escherichia coli]|nr:hypothetical protein ECZU20_55520 [Escherichia coli]
MGFINMRCIYVEAPNLPRPVFNSDNQRRSLINYREGRHRSSILVSSESFGAPPPPVNWQRVTIIISNIDAKPLRALQPLRTHSAHSSNKLSRSRLTVQISRIVTG